MNRGFLLWIMWKNGISLLSLLTLEFEILTANNAPQPANIKFGIL